MKNVPDGLCECGCGNKTTISDEDNIRYGWVKGIPKRFCKGHANKKFHNINQIFWSRAKVGNPNECWTWKGAIRENGYGRVTYKKRSYYAHRLSYEVHYGAIPPGFLVCHKCDNRSCVNPNHLFLGNYFDNMADMVNKERQNSPRGEQLAKKLRTSDIIEIRDLHQWGITNADISRRFHISGGMVSLIVNKKRWSHI